MSTPLASGGLEQRKRALGVGFGCADHAGATMERPRVPVVAGMANAARELRDPRLEPGTPRGVRLGARWRPEGFEQGRAVAPALLAFPDLRPCASGEDARVWEQAQRAARRAAQVPPVVRLVDD